MHNSIQGHINAFDKCLLTNFLFQKFKSCNIISFDGTINILLCNKPETWSVICLSGYPFVHSYGGFKYIMDPVVNVFTHYNAHFTKTATSNLASVSQEFTGIQIYQNMATSFYLQVVAIVSCLFVVVSTLCLIFSTLPAFQIKDEDGNISRESLIICS